MIAEVVVDIKNKAVDRVFDYEIPIGFDDIVMPGIRVIVPFGPRSLSGVVLKVKSHSDYDKKLRPIRQVLDVVPVLNAELLQLGIDLAKETGATMISCFDAMIPAAMRTKHKKKFVLSDVESRGFLDQRIVGLFGSVDVLDEGVVPKELLKVLKEEINAGRVEVVYEHSQRLGQKTKRYVELVNRDVDLSVVGRSKKQLDVVETLMGHAHPMARDELDATAAVLKALADKGVVRYLDVEVYRDPYASKALPEGCEMVLNPSQREAVDVIGKASSEVVLVHGVTGSGKTEVYLEAITNALSQGKQALVLIPEITLTTQLMGRFKRRFGDQVAVLHSRLSMGERYDEWRKILRKEVNVVIGARSAVFAPLDNIGLIVLDEEHEATYKQEEMPRYHTLEVAKRRGLTHDCPVVLGSATPSLDSYARASKGVYQLATLKERAVDEAKLPTVHLVDMNRQKFGTGSGMISVELEEAIGLRLEKEEQVILFLNRRGYANFMQCRECHSVVSCPNCDVTLTYHKQVNGLKCHYCNFTAQVVEACPKCESKEVQFFGTGTQKIEEFLRTRFPEAKVLRMDVDSSSKKGDHQRIIEAFEKKEADILIGTQMVAKGLDFPGVTLVGVVDADVMLHFPDFKAAERTFQILTQVAGRAGRHEKEGEVLIETYSPYHYAMEGVRTQDYNAFYKKEMEMRRRFKYAPYFYHAKVHLSSLDPEQLLVVSEQVNDYLRNALEEECLIIGPAMPGVARVNNRFRMHFILKYRQAPNLKNAMTELLELLDHKEVSVAVDYFPVHLT